MDHSGHIIFAALGFSASLFLCLPNLRRWQNKQIKMQKLKMVNEALAQAEETVMRYEERHDHILGQICSYYMINQELHEALVSARNAMHEALGFAVAFRNLKMEIVAGFAKEDVSMFEWLRERTERRNTTLETTS